MEEVAAVQRTGLCVCCPRACVAATGIWCCCRNNSTPRAAATTFDFAWSPSLRARTTLAAVRLSYGIILLAYTIWSWVFTTSDSLSFFRICAQFTTWGLVLTVVFFIFAGVAGLSAPRSGSAAQSCGRARGCAASSAPGLFATAFSFEVSITILAWALFAEFDTGSLGIFIVNHSQILPLIIDLGGSRITIGWQHIAAPLIVFAAYVAVAGIYSISAQRGPYDALSFTDPTTAAAVFITLGAILVAFLFLKFLSDARDRGRASAASYAGQGNIAVT
jgi:hypothetical protein